MVVAPRCLEAIASRTRDDKAIQEGYFSRTEKRVCFPNSRGGDLGVFEVVFWPKADSHERQINAEGFQKSTKYLGIGIGSMCEIF